jgi:glycosyltransferase involved in cell wall biosynthesis
MKGPLVSVVVPVYNAEPFVAAALDSVLAQDYEPIEVIAVDDGSTDSSAAVVKLYPQVRYIHQENAGPSAARNVGVEAAQGEFVAFVDADDIATPNKLSVQVGYLLEHPGTVCVLGRQHWMNPPEGLARDTVWGDLDGIPIMSMVVRRDVLLEVGGYAPEVLGPDGRYRATDLEMLVRLRQYGYEHVVLPEIVLQRRHHGGNLVAGHGLGPIPAISLKQKLDRARTAARARENAGEDT